VCVWCVCLVWLASFASAQPPPLPFPLLFPAFQLCELGSNNSVVVLCLVVALGFGLDLLLLLLASHSVKVLFSLCVF
jgi:hypothetical protein